MIYYELIVKCTFEQAAKKELPFGDGNTAAEKMERQFKTYNERHFIKESGTQSELIYSYDEDRIFVAFSQGIEDVSVKERIRKIKGNIGKMESIESVEVESCREITAVSMKEICEDTSRSDLAPCGFHRRFRNREWDYLDTCNFDIEEEVISPESVTLKQAEKMLDGLMADKTVRDEIRRIYDRKNSRVFFGYPVHYRIEAGNRAAAKDIASFMVRTLHSKNRIPGTRLTVISGLDVMRHDKDLELLIKNTGGTAVMIELQGDKDEDRFASDKTRTARIVADFVEEYSKDTLFFLFESTENEGFAGEAISRLEKELDMVCLKEGRGDENEAREYMKRVIQESRYAELMDESSYSYLKKRKSFHASDVRDAVDEWSRMCLREKAYSAYSKCGRTRSKVKPKEKKAAYAELQKMIGLEDVKTLVDDILAYYKLNNARSRYIGEDKGSLSRHMIFTGNPGCAKTTVARLLADILLEEGIVTTGKYVECGRADLVGRYVGWTAKTVQAKFTQAKGGVLFIDEAYSLVDNSRTFGDEAINTIVQEMENHRDDVIVIFAGYPEPMEEFLNKNEGLRSRIAFHVEFPDYNEDELYEILALMVRERGYKMNPGCKNKCMDIFKSTVKTENFGNGRFARNLLEHAIMRQAGRLAGKGARRNYSKDTLLKLVPGDFEDIGVLSTGRCKKMKVGF